MALTLAEQIDQRLFDLYFETGIKVVRERWLVGRDGSKLYLKLGQGIEYEGATPCTTSATRRTKEESSTE